MSFLTVYFVLNIILLILTLIYYFIKWRETRLNIYSYDIKLIHYGKYFITIFSVILVILFCLNSKYLPFKDKSYVNSLIMNISMFILFGSIIIFIKSFYISGSYDIMLDYPSRMKSKRGTVKLGKIMYKNRQKHNFLLNLTDLAQHMFVCGITGTGKSNLIQYFLMNFTKRHDIPFLLTEFKGEYHFLQEKIEDLLILKPGENFSINIFDPEGADPQVHAERVFQIFESGGLLEGVEYSPQMERAFVDVLNKVCPKEENRNWESFKQISEKYGAENNDLMYKKSVTAIQNRIRRYSLGTLKDIFVKKSGFEAKKLFNYRVLLDLSSILRLGGEKEDALFFLNMILKYLWDRNIEIGSKNYEGIKHITIIEDAQYFAPEELSSRTKLTSYIEDIALLLRGTGECLITLATRPKISKEILANCGVLIAFQNHMQKDVMQELLNLEEKQKEYLSMLQKGQCIIRINSIEKPFVLRTPYIERSWLTDEEILENNKKILESKLKELENKIKEKGDESKIEKSYCKFCGKEVEDNSDYCINCSTNLSNEDIAFENLKIYIKKLYEEEQNKK